MASPAPRAPAPGSFDAALAELTRALLSRDLPPQLELVFRRRLDLVAGASPGATWETTTLAALALLGSGSQLFRWAYPPFCLRRHLWVGAYTAGQLAIRRELFGVAFPPSPGPSQHRLPRQLASRAVVAVRRRLSARPPRL